MDTRTHVVTQLGPCSEACQSRFRASEAWLVGMVTSFKGVSKNNGKTPQIIYFHRVFHYFHHPFWGNLIFGNTLKVSKDTKSLL